MTDWQLRKLERFGGVEGPVVVCVMDGVGCGGHDEGDAVFLARTPNLALLSRQPAVTRLLAHGTAVGMPSDDDMGNSEVGHNAFGAGRTFDQGAKLVDQAIASGALFTGATFRALVQRCREHRSPIHFIGLLSDGNVHSHIEHLFALLRRARRRASCAPASTCCSTGATWPRPARCSTSTRSSACSRSCARAAA